MNSALLMKGRLAVLAGLGILIVLSKTGIEGGLEVMGNISCRTGTQDPLWLWSLKTGARLKGCCALHLPKVETLHFC